jgi:tetrahydromethanopterin S-methyltransferase subunit D
MRKVLLIAAAAVVVIVGGTALAYQIWWQTRGAEVVATLGDGTRFGTGKDLQACVTEAVLRVKRSNSLIGFTDQVKNELFLEECLKVAQPVTGFCVGVPPQSDTAASASWREQMGGKYGLEGTLQQGLVTEIQTFCNTDAAQH